MKWAVFISLEFAPSLSLSPLLNSLSVESLLWNANLSNHLQICPIRPLMSNRREHRASRSAVYDSFDDIEEGGLGASSSYSSDISEHHNDKAIDTLKERVTFLKRLTGDVHDEVLSHNRMLEKMGNNMDASRGILSRTVDRFKMVFENKSGRRMSELVGYFVLLFLVFYFLYRVLRRT